MGRIARTAAESGPKRDLFFQIDRNTAQFWKSLLQDPVSLGDEIPFACFEPGFIGREPETARDLPDPDGIAEGYPVKDREKIVIPVKASLEDAEMEVEFCRALDRDGIHGVFNLFRAGDTRLEIGDPEPLLWIPSLESFFLGLTVFIVLQNRQFVQAQFYLFYFVLPYKP